MKTFHVELHVDGKVLFSGVSSAVTLGPSSLVVQLARTQIAGAKRTPRKRRKAKVIGKGNG